jgi:carbonic anhydrase
MTDPHNRDSIQPAMEHQNETVGPNRRHLMNLTGAGIATAITGISAASQVAEASQPGSTIMSPGQALQRLRQGNNRYVAWRRGLGRLENMPVASAVLTQPGSDQNFQNSQTPFTIVLGCSDSRVPPELIFDEGFGNLFVTRTAGQTCDPIVLGTIEYAAFEIGSPPLLLVLGHARCGAVTAAVDSVVNGSTPPGWIRNAVTPILPAARQAHREMPRATIDAKVARAIRLQAAEVTDQIAYRSPWLRSRIQTGQFLIEPAFYDLDTGIVYFLRNG